MMKPKNVINATSRIRGECSIVGFTPANGDLTGCPPMLPYVCESVVWARTRAGYIKTSKRIEVYGWSVLAPNSQRRNLNQDVFLRRLFYRRFGGKRGGIPPSAVIPSSIKPGVPGTRFKG